MNLIDRYNYWIEDHKHPFTPNIMKVEYVDSNTLKELSNGKAMSEGNIYGVSILTEDGNGGFKTGDDRSKSFHSLKEAVAYFKVL